MADQIRLLLLVWPIFGKIGILLVIWQRQAGVYVFDAAFGTPLLTSEESRQ